MNLEGAMDKLQIFGGEKLFGSIEIPSSKNAFLPILAATILCEGKVVLHKNPRFYSKFAKQNRMTLWIVF